MKMNQYRVLSPDGVDDNIKSSDTEWVEMVTENWKTSTIYLLHVIVQKKYSWKTEENTKIS